MKTINSFIAHSFVLTTSLLITSFLVTSSLIAQVPQGIPYQAMIRGNDGAALVNANVTVRFTLHQNTTTGPVEYQETQALTTNVYGLINTQFGTGTPTQGTFAGIVWSNTSKFIQVEANDGNGYVDMGTQQMMSVPYAMYAGSAGQSIVPLGTQTGDMLYWDSETGTWISLTSGTNGQALYNCDGVPTWGGCTPILGNLSISSITPFTAYAEFPMTSNGGNAPTNIGFYLSTSSNVSPSNGQFFGGTWPGCDACFVTNPMNSLAASIPGGNGTVKSGNDGTTSISNLSPNTQYYIIGSVTNSKGTTSTPVLSFNTPVLVEGCMESGACNYNPSANYNVGCFYASYGYLCDGSCAGDTDQDGVCDAFDACSDINACNYNNPGNPGCAFDSDGDNVCDDQDGCLDNNACNWQVSIPFTSCQFAEMYRNCDGTCINDLDGDNTCDEIDGFICANDIDNDQVCDDIDNFICANDMDNDQVCDDIDQCTDVSACNYNLPVNQICSYDTDNDGICDDIDQCTDVSACNYNLPVNQICSFDTDIDGICDDIDQCTDVNACNYNQHWIDVGYGEFYTCRYDIDGDGFCSLNPNYGYNDNYNLYDQNENISYSNENGQFVSIPLSSFDFCEDISACNVTGNGVVFGTILNSNDGSITRDLGTLMSWHYNSNSGSYSSVSGYDYLPSVGFLGCVFDTDLDGICDTEDHCRDLNACNYNHPENEWCFPDLDSDGICDNLDGCFSTDYCTYSNPTATSCQNTGGPCNTTDPNATYAIYDANCVCQQYYAGCTEPNACNFDSNAWPDNGTCLYFTTSCDDGDSYTINDMINSNCQCQGSPPLYTPGAGVTDIDGNFYPSVILYGQEWMQKNLAVSKYRNGDPIPTGLDAATWHSSAEGACTIYANNISNNDIHGKMYNWYAAVDPRGLCPAGWHTPTSTEWLSLMENLGGYYVAGAKLKSSIAWDNSYSESTNESGFTALPSGMYFDGTYGSIGIQTWWWSSGSFIDPEYGLFGSSNFVYSYGPEFVSSTDNTNAGLSVRCIKD